MKCKLLLTRATIFPWNIYIALKHRNMIAFRHFLVYFVHQSCYYTIFLSEMFYLILLFVKCIYVQVLVQYCSSVLYVFTLWKKLLWKPIGDHTTREKIIKRFSNAFLKGIIMQHKCTLNACQRKTWGLIGEMVILKPIGLELTEA